MKRGIAVTFAIIGIIALVFLLELGGLQWTKFFAPKHENVRREVFQATRSYNEGKIQDLVRYRLEYMRATEEDKEIIVSTVRHMYADYPVEKVPLELRSFLRTVKLGGY